MATHSSVLAWRIPGTGEPGGLPSVGSHRVGHDWSDLAVAAVYSWSYANLTTMYFYNIFVFFPKRNFVAISNSFLLILTYLGFSSVQFSNSVMSDSVRPHRRQPTRLPCTWDSPGKNTGVGCHFLLQCMKVESESEVAQSCPTLSDPMDCSPPGSSIHGIFQARVLEWGAIAFSIHID